MQHYRKNTYIMKHNSRKNTYTMKHNCRRMLTQRNARQKKPYTTKCGVEKTLYNEMQCKQNLHVNTMHAKQKYYANQKQRNGYSMKKEYGNFSFSQIMITKLVSICDHITRACQGFILRGHTFVNVITSFQVLW